MQTANMKPRFSRYKQEPGKSPEPVFIMTIGDQTVEVDGETLLANCYPVPMTPIFRTWKNYVDRKVRCGKCWEPVNGTDELVEHDKLRHSVLEAA